MLTIKTPEQRQWLFSTDDDNCRQYLFSTSKPALTYSKQTMKKMWKRCSGACIKHFRLISQMVLAFQLLTLNK